MCLPASPAHAIPTGTGGEEFPLGTGAGDDFNVGSGKLVVEGDTGRVGVADTSPDYTFDVTGSIRATTSLNTPILAVTSSADIDGGTIDGTKIGSASASDATFTDTTITGLTASKCVETDANKKLVSAAGACGGGAISVTVGGAVTSGTTNRVLYQDSSDQVAEDADLQFDGTTLTVTTVDLNGGTIDGTKIGAATPADGTFSSLRIVTAAHDVTADGVLTTDTGSYGSVGTPETDLGSYTIPANSLLDDGDYVEYEVFGTTAANGNNKRIQVYLGATVILDTGSAAFNNRKWLARGYIYRTTSATAQKYWGIWTAGDGTTYVIASAGTAAENLATDLTLKVTGDATSDNDVVQTLITVKICRVH